MLALQTLLHRRTCATTMRSPSADLLGSSSSPGNEDPPALFLTTRTTTRPPCSLPSLSSPSRVSRRLALASASASARAHAYFTLPSTAPLAASALSLPSVTPAFTYPSLKSCPTSTEYSCTTDVSPENTCCAPGAGQGLFLATQFWSPYTGLEDEGQFLPKNSWGIHGVGSPFDRPDAAFLFSAVAPSSRCLS